MSDDVVREIYEAALVPELWPNVLDRVSAMAGSIGGAVLTTGGRHPPRWAASDTVAPALQAFASSDAWKNNKRPERWLSRKHPGFLRDVDLFTPEELDQNAEHLELKTKGLGWQLGTVIPMPSGEVVVISLERKFEAGPHDLRMRDAVDPLRPHLARSGLIAARLGLERARTAVATLQMIGLPAAVTTSTGRVLVANDLVDQFDIFLPGAGGVMALRGGGSNAMLSEAVADIAAGHVASRSIPVAAQHGKSAAIVHVLPLSGAAHDIFSGAAVLLTASVLSLTTPASDTALLNGLFDLSPAEARLAATLASGLPLKEAAAAQNIAFSTARSYLEGIFRKTGTRQQSQLVALLKSATHFPPSR